MSIISGKLRGKRSSVWWRVLRVSFGTPVFRYFFFGCEEEESLPIILAWSCSWAKSRDRSKDRHQPFTRLEFHFLCHTDSVTSIQNFKAELPWPCLLSWIVKTKNFDMIDRITNTISPLERGKKILHQHPEHRFSYQTSLRKLHSQYKSCEIVLTTWLSQLWLLASPGTCNARSYKQPVGRSWASNFISSSMFLV